MTMASGSLRISDSLRAALRVGLLAKTTWKKRSCTRVGRATFVNVKGLTWWARSLSPSAETMTTSQWTWCSKAETVVSDRLCPKISRVSCLRTVGMMEFKVSDLSRTRVFFYDDLMSECRIEKWDYLILLPPFRSLTSKYSIQFSFMQYKGLNIIISYDISCQICLNFGIQRL